MGNIIAGLTQMYPPKAKWGVDDIPDLTGQVMIVTGGAVGIGRETVKALLQHGAKVHIATRSEKKAQAAIEQLKAETGKEALFLKLDLADLVSVRKAAEEFLSKESELHVLFNNAGVMGPSIDELTLFAATASGKHGKARVVTVSSSASYLTNEVKYETLRDGKERRRLDSMSDLYFQSKFGNVLFARELARRYGDKLVSTSTNPGNIQSELQRYLTGIRKFFIDKIVYPTPMGAITQLWAGTAAETADYNGKFLIPWARLGKPNPATEDPKAAEKLWNWMEEQVKDF